LTTPGATGLARPAPRTAPPISLLAIILFIALLALNGAGLALSAFRAEAGAPAAPAIGEPVGTSYGSITVVLAETLDGLTSEELGGMTHGVGNLVPAGSAQVEVSVRLANTGSHPIRVTPDQVRLVAGASEPVEPTGASVRPMRLGAGATLEAVFTFVVPQSGDALTFAYTDPESRAVLAIPVGVIGQAPAGASDDHHD
jgi:hypothetical protein